MDNRKSAHQSCQCKCKSLPCTLPRPTTSTQNWINLWDCHETAMSDYAHTTVVSLVWLPHILNTVYVRGTERQTQTQRETERQREAKVERGLSVKRMCTELNLARGTEPSHETTYCISYTGCTSLQCSIDILHRPQNLKNSQNQLFWFYHIPG